MNFIYSVCLWLKYIHLHVQYIISRNVGLVAKQVHYKLEVIGSIPCLYTTPVIFHCILEMQSHIGQEQHPKPIFKIKCCYKSSEAQQAGLVWAWFWKANFESQNSKNRWCSIKISEKSAKYQFIAEKSVIKMWI